MGMKNFWKPLLCMAAVLSVAPFVSAGSFDDLTRMPLKQLQASADAPVIKSPPGGPVIGKNPVGQVMAAYKAAGGYTYKIDAVLAAAAVIVGAGLKVPSFRRSEQPTPRRFHIPPPPHA
jgi:hypothetical protein